MTTASGLLPGGRLAISALALAVGVVVVTAVSLTLGSQASPLAEALAALDG